MSDAINASVPLDEVSQDPELEWADRTVKEMKEANHEFQVKVKVQVRPTFTLPTGSGIRWQCECCHIPQCE
eukprot:9136139-Pyramimonas_sp.AAC.1